MSPLEWTDQILSTSLKQFSDFVEGGNLWEEKLSAQPLAEKLRVPQYASCIIGIQTS